MDLAKKQSFSPKLIVLTPDPASPGQITIGDVTPTTMEFCWQPAFGNPAMDPPNWEYTVFVIPPSGEIETNKNFIVQAGTVPLCLTVDDLNPSTQYLIEVQTMLRRDPSFAAQQGDTKRILTQTTGNYKMRLKSNKKI